MVRDLGHTLIGRSPQPRVRANTLLGTMPVSQTGNDPGLLPVIIQMAPVVMAILYHNLQGWELADNTILGDLVCQESALRKEGTDVEVLVLRVHLYTKTLRRHNFESIPSISSARNFVGTPTSPTPCYAA